MRAYSKLQIFKQEKLCMPRVTCNIHKRFFTFLFVSGSIDVTDVLWCMRNMPTCYNTKKVRYNYILKNLSVHIFKRYLAFL